MATSLVTTCPHCLAKQIALTVVWTIEESAKSGLIFLRCPNCDDPSSARISTSDLNTYFQHAVQAARTINHLNFKVDAIWPSYPQPNIPDALPPTVHKAMLQAEGNFTQAGHEDAAGVMYRKALEMGLKSIDASLTGSLAAKISTLGSRGKLTPDLVTWAGEIRILGNESAHDEGLDRKELSSLRSLTDLVLQYLFSIPALVTARKAEAAK